MIQLIKREGNKWHMLINGKSCIFTPIVLYLENNLFPEKPDTEKGLRWRINRKWVSYKQIKKTTLTQ